MTNGERVLLDSVILIDHFNGISAATAYLNDLGALPAISAITRAEVLAGFEIATAQGPKALLDRYRLLAIDREIADLAAELRRQHHWKLPDAFQAAVATHHGLVLATRNKRDFSPQRHRFVRIPYTIEG